MIYDAQGICHPRRFGLASHLGLWSDIPSIGSKGRPERGLLFSGRRGLQLGESVQRIPTTKGAKSSPDVPHELSTRLRDIKRLTSLPADERYDELEDPVYYSAPAVIFVIGSGLYASDSCPLACENLMLAALSLGLGTCWVKLGSLITDNPEIAGASGAAWPFRYDELEAICEQIIKTKPSNPGAYLKLVEIYEKQGKPMPMAVITGYDPIVFIVSCTRTPPGIDEFHLAGALRGEPLEMVQCKTIDIEVPATCELVFEGFIQPHVRHMEGGFGEYTGYYGEARSNPVLRSNISAR
jgi:hypothetical protein